MTGSPPFALGIITRRTGSGRYVFETSSARKPANHASRPCSSMRENVIPSTRCTRINAGEPIGVDQDALATDLVVKQIEADGGLRLRFAVELSLKAPDLISWHFDRPRFQRKTHRLLGGRASGNASYPDPKSGNRRPHSDDRGRPHLSGSPEIELPPPTGSSSPGSPSS
jgi:hypothetical protein